MSSIAIRAAGLSKQFRIGQIEAQRTLRDSLAGVTAWPGRALRSLWRSNGRPRSEVSTIWALQDVSFEIPRGEVVGVIGANGAGKSTLLKILSRITEPTSGEAVIHGRVGSLLEVGTGFHLELTGRENIYLNGAILGMRRAEIERRFDEMVAFAEVEKFIDTPVKHYSSGMYLRLAFAVAAHLDPEILLVDEVLAVGDASFQNKCLGKMGQVAQGGRTVLFVSHNLNAVSTLCQSALLLERGRLAATGNVDEVIQKYLSERTTNPGTVVLDSSAPASDLRLRSISVQGADGVPRGVFDSSEPIFILLELEIESPTRDLCLGFDLSGPSGAVVFRTYQNDQCPADWPVLRPGRNLLRCTVPPGLLNAGHYHISPRLSEHCKRWLIRMEHVISFQVTLRHGVSPFWTALQEGSRPGVTAPILRWDAPDIH